MRRERLAYAVLFVVPVAVFWPLVHCQFVHLDDSAYVFANPNVQQGLTLANVAWAFRTLACANWHPVTWLSHMLDCQLFGLNAGAHHFVNLLFHAINTLLLFHVLKRMTGELWPSTVVAALFALHPLHVQSVAWVSERKDVLSTFFFMLTLSAYLRYVEESKVQSPKSKVWYGWALVLFVLGLMSKPVLVTLPFLLLLLDFWPLGRVSGVRYQVSGSESGVAETRGLPSSQPDSEITNHQPASIHHPPCTLHYPRSTLWRLVIEKIPFFVLSIASCVITIIAQRAAGAMSPSDLFDFSTRFDNALVSYIRYLGMALWPHHLAILYPYRFKWPEWEIIGSAVLLAWISLGAWQQRGPRPYLSIGWLWFLGTLVPVIGLAQVGGQALADRYMYIPSIGLFLMIVWGVRDLSSRWPLARVAVGLAAAAALVACGLVTRGQLRYWRNTEALYRHTLDVTADNATVEFQLAKELVRKGKADEALKLVEHALPRNEALDYINSWAWNFATDENPKLRNGPEAVRLAERACELTHYQVTGCIDTLAAAYAAAGRYEDAVKTEEKALASAIAQGDTAKVEQIHQLLERYRAGQPYPEKIQR